MGASDMIRNLINKKKGYEPSNFNEEIDDGNSVTIGYS
jgi:hypothetical protein